MRLKSELYKDKQTEIRKRFYSILNIPEQTEFLAVHIETNSALLTNIMELIPEIRRYFSTSNLKAFSDATKIKRPWFSVFKLLVKEDYELVITDCYLPEQKMKTRKYTLVKRFKD